MPDAKVDERQDDQAEDRRDRGARDSAPHRGSMSCCHRVRRKPPKPGVRGAGAAREAGAVEPVDASVLEPGDGEEHVDERDQEQEADAEDGHEGEADAEERDEHGEHDGPDDPDRGELRDRAGHAERR